VDECNDGKDMKQSSKRLMFMKDLYMTNFRLFVEILFEVEGLAKPTQALITILIQLVEM